MKKFAKQGMITARAAIGEGYSAEIHRSGPSALSLPYRRWHVVSWYASACRMVRTMGDMREETHGAPGFTGVFPAGEGERIEWLDPVEAVHLHIDPDSVSREGRTVRPLRANPSVDEQLADIMGELYEVLAVSAEREPGLVDRLVAGARERIAVGASLRDESPRSIGAAFLAEVLDAMHGLPAVDASLASLAELAELSQDEFGRRFRAVFGTSPHDYLLVSRIEMAKHALCNTDKPLAQIALDCGFFDQAHLANTFRKRSGLTIGEFRRRFAR